jgi:hypothetical protein
VPDTGQWRTVIETGRTLAPSRAYRYYVTVPVGASDLSVRLAVPDTSQLGFLYLHEPSGRPSRTGHTRVVGRTEGLAGVLSVTANDIRPGVWEAVVQAAPGLPLRYDFAASVPAVSIARVDSTEPVISFFSPAATDTTLMASVDQVGVETGWEATVEHGGPYRRTFVAPEWATGATVEVELTPEFWNGVTDFGIVIYDTTGEQLGQGAMNYDFHRVTVDLPPKRSGPFPVTVELFPAFALPTPPAAFTATVRLAFTGPARPLARGPLVVPPHGTATLRIPPFASLAESPAWWDLVHVRVAGSDSDWVAIERLIPVREQ